MPRTEGIGYAKASSHDVNLFGSGASGAMFDTHVLKIATPLEVKRDFEASEITGREAVALLLCYFENRRPHCEAGEEKCVNSIQSAWATENSNTACHLGCQVLGSWRARQSCGALH